MYYDQRAKLKRYEHLWTIYEIMSQLINSNGIHRWNLFKEVKHKKKKK